jgi:hypothetical protein
MSNKKITILFFLQLILLTGVILFFISNKDKNFDSVKNNVVYTDTISNVIHLTNINSSGINMFEYLYYPSSDMTFENIKRISKKNISVHGETFTVTGIDKDGKLFQYSEIHYSGSDDTKRMMSIDTSNITVYSEQKELAFDFECKEWFELNDTLVLYNMPINLKDYYGKN